MPQAAQPPAPEQQPSSPPQQTDETDEDYEELERDADGLVSISRCLETAYDERDGKMWCRMCECVVPIPQRLSALLIRFGGIDSGPSNRLGSNNHSRPCLPATKIASFDI